MPHPRASSPAPWLLLIGSLVVVLGVVLALQLLDDDLSSAPDPTTASAPDPGRALAGNEPAAAPSHPIERLAPEQPTDPVPAPPEWEQELLDMEMELERLGLTDLDPDARAVIEGLVVDGLDQPLPSTMVNLFDHRGDHSTAMITDVQGRFRFVSDRPRLAGWSLSTAVVVEAFPDDPGATAPATYIHSDDLRPGEPAVSVKLVVAPAPRLEGVVLDGSTGAAARFAAIEVLSRANAWQATSQFTFTEADASFSLALTQIPAHDILIRASDPTGRQCILGPLSLSPGEVRFVELTLREPVSISGRIIDEMSGKALTGARVTSLPIQPRFAQELNQTVTDDQGHFTLDGLNPSPGWLRLHVTADGHASALVSVSDSRQALQVRLGPAVVLSGTIHDMASELPVRFASITCAMPSMLAAGPSWTDTTLCDEQGHFELLLRVVPPSAALLLVDSPGHLLSRRPLADLVPLQLGSSTYELRIDLARAHAR